MRIWKFNDGNGPPLSVTIVTTGSSSPVSSSTWHRSRKGRPQIASYSASASSTAAIASCWFPVGEMWKGYSYLEYQSRPPGDAPDSALGGLRSEERRVGKGYRAQRAHQ